MPLTPLYQQGTPLMPLAFRLNAVNAVIPEKTCVYKKSDFLTTWRMRNSWSIIYLIEDYEAFRAYLLESVGELREQQSGLERGGIGSVIELAMAKQIYQKIDLFATWLVGVLQKFWQF